MNVRRWQVILIALLATLVVACEREKRQFQESPSSLSSTPAARQTELQPGEPQPTAEVANEFEENAVAVSEGKRLFQWYNCSGCHANGGGGMGPALMDDQWIYGDKPQNIYDTIIEGRPNGMPSFGNKIPGYEIKEIAAYVRSLSGQLRKDVSPGRNDDLYGKPTEQSTPNQRAARTPAEHPQ
jgi:cytochrome c oxidase cbb3-type subunit 3